MKNRAVLIRREGSQTEGPGKRFEIIPPTVLGRSPDSTIVVDDPNVSRHHCRIEFEANEFLVRDLRSANGTYLNTKRINAAALRHGDVIGVGTTTFTFQTWAPAPRDVSTIPGAVAASRLPAGKTPFDSIDLESGVARMGKALEKYKLLYQVGEIIANLDRRPEVFFQLILEQIFERLPADRGIVVLGTGPEALDLVASRARVPEAGRVPISSTILRRVYETGESLLIADSLLDDRLYGSDSVMGGASRSILCAALQHLGQVVGAVQIESTRLAGAFDENDLQLLAAIGRQAAAALMGVRLAEQKERLVHLAELRRSLPSDLAEQLLPDRERWTRPASVPLVVMVVDLRRLLGTGAGANPEALFGRAREVLDLLEQAVFRQRGAVGKLTGDALMAFWGAPSPCEDAPLRAARAALECVERVPEASVGVHSGPALVGTFGGTHRADYTALGPVVDLASRLCGLAAPGEVLLTEQLHETLFGNGLGQWRQVKKLLGVAGPARLFQLQGLVAA